MIIVNGTVAFRDRVPWLSTQRATRCGPMVQRHISAVRGLAAIAAG